MSERAIPIANIYYLFCYAWDHVEEHDVVRYTISWERFSRRGSSG